MYIRTKTRIRGSEKFIYAYLVSSKYKKAKKSPRQKVKAYLGRVFSLDKVNNGANDAPKANNEQLSPIQQLLIQELLNHGFTHITPLIFSLKEPQITVNLRAGEILNTNSQKKACLKLNLGFLSSYSLKEIWNYKPPKGLLPMQLGKHLAKTLLSAGITLEQESFLSLFSTISSTMSKEQQRSTMVNNDQQ